MDTQDTFHLYIQTNSPGELSNWVYPLVKRTKELYPKTHITIFLVPCQYASRSEKKIARQIPGVSEVWDVKKTLKTLSKGKWFKQKHKQGAVLYAGGGPLYSQLLGLKFKLPVYGYSEKQHSLGPLFKKTFYKHEVGDLMAERSQTIIQGRSDLLKKYNLKDVPYLLFFTGSRPLMFKALAPFMLEVIQYMQKKKPNLHVIIQISPFISEGLAKKTFKKNLKNITVLRADSKEIMSLSEWLITIPGTNTAEAQYVSLPMIVLLPLNRPDLIIFDGLLGLLGKIPGLGTALKRLVIKHLQGKKQFYAHPNRNSGKEIVPEIVGNLDPKETSDKILKIIENDQNKENIKKELRELNQFKNTSKEIIEYIMTAKPL